MTKNPFNAFGGTGFIRDYYHVVLTEPSETPVRPEIFESAPPDESKLKDRDAYYDYLIFIEIFRTEKNPAAGLIAFRNCFNAGIYPPEDLIKWLSTGIEEWMGDGGNTNLEKVLRLSKVASGSTRAIDQVTKYQRDVEISIELRQLMANFNLGAESAATMIQHRMAEDNVPNTISAPTILREIVPFMKSHAKTYGNFGVSSLSDEQKREVLKSYPYIDFSIKK